MSKKSTLAYLSLITIAVLAISLSVSGCTTTRTVPTAEIMPSPATGATVAPTTQASTTTAEGTDPWKAAFKFDQLHWYTYTKVGGSEVKIEYADEAYNGQPARKITTSIDGKKTQESYVDPANDQFLAGKMYLGGMEMEMGESDFNSMANDEYFTLDDPEDFTTGLKATAETVTTAKGTFTATKYVTGNKYETFWVSADAPLPVKYYTSVTGFTWEPTSWG